MLQERSKRSPSFADILALALKQQSERANEFEIQQNIDNDNRRLSMMALDSEGIHICIYICVCIYIFMYIYIYIYI
jgi:hypothetical protein